MRHYKNNGIHIHYCNWDKDQEISKKNVNAHYLGRGVLEFNEVNHRFIKFIEKEIVIDDEMLEKLIADLDSDKKENVTKVFMHDLNSIWDEFNDNPKHDFRNMCVGDVIEFISSNYEVRFMVKPLGFELIV